MHRRVPTPGSRLRPAAAAAEFAVILPLLAVLVVGAVELGRAITVRQALNDAVRKGCRVGMLPNCPTSDITDNVNDVLTDNGIDSTAATVTVLVNGKSVDASTAVRNDQISVSVSVPCSTVSWGFSTFLGSTATLSSTLAMQRT
jgi:Flp pilus assembly protein TadG